MLVVVAEEELGFWVSGVWGLVGLFCGCLGSSCWPSSSSVMIAIGESLDLLRMFLSGELLSKGI